jgi:hypothetical protein
MARDKGRHVPTVSWVPETNLTPATVVPVAPALSEAEIVALVATCLRRYSQAMVWDVQVDKMEHLTEPACTFGSLHPIAMSPKGEMSLPLETELILKTKDYAWKSVVLLLNIPAIMRDIRLVIISPNSPVGCSRVSPYPS